MIQHLFYAKDGHLYTVCVEQDSVQGSAEKFDSIDLISEHKSIVVGGDMYNLHTTIPEELNGLGFFNDDSDCFYWSYNKLNNTSSYPDPFDVDLENKIVHHIYIEEYTECRGDSGFFSCEAELYNFDEMVDYVSK